MQAISEITLCAFTTSVTAVRCRWKTWLLLSRRNLRRFLLADEPEQEEAYFFWLIELFCDQNGVSVVVHYVIVEAKFSKMKNILKSARINMADTQDI